MMDCSENSIFWQLINILQAQYEATEIPVPSDNGLEAQLEAKAAADEVAVADYIKKVDGQIAEASVTLNNIKALPPFGKIMIPYQLIFLIFHGLEPECSITCSKIGIIQNK